MLYIPPASSLRRGGGELPYEINRAGLMKELRGVLT